MNYASSPLEQQASGLASLDHKARIDWQYIQTAILDSILTYELFHLIRSVTSSNFIELSGSRLNFKMPEKKLGFAENFLLSGVAAGVSKTAAAPIERVKLLVQNQDEMIKQGRLDKPYNGVIDCTKRVLQTEGVYPFWRG